MAWAAPVFCSINAALDGFVVASNPWTADEAMTTGYPLTNLHDGRMQTQARWSSSGTGHYVDLDRGASGQSVDRVILVNHNLAGKRIRIQGGASTSTDSEFLASTFITSTNGTIATYDINSFSSRYLRISFPTTACQPQIGQIIITKADSLTRGPVQGWNQSVALDRVVYPSGATILANRTRQRFEFEWRKLDATDLAELRYTIIGRPSVEHYGTRPIVVYGPYHTVVTGGGTTGAYVMNVESYEETADVEVPADDDYLARVRISLLEQLA